MQTLDELQLVSLRDLVVRHFIHHGPDQMRPSTAQRNIVHGLCADPCGIGRLALIEQCELHLPVIYRALEFDRVVVTTLVGVSNHVGQGLVDCQSNADAFLIRQTAGPDQPVYRSAHDRQEAGITRHK